MGAVPSRESCLRNLYGVPDYGQHNRIVLIPLTKDFFPSPECLLSQQLFSARCDTFVRYYHAFEEGFIRSDGKDGEREIENPVWRQDAFPSRPCTAEEFYDAYVSRGGESLLFDTDAEMIAAHSRDSNAVRPLPCAVAFSYDQKVVKSRKPTYTSHTTCVLPYNSDDNATVDENHKEKGSKLLQHSSGRAAKAKSRGDASAYSTDVADTVVVCGCRVQVVGFFGDVTSLRPGGHTQLRDSDIQLQIFIKKSVGDHNCTHIFLAGLYTYAAQWQFAVAAASAAGSLSSTRLSGCTTVLPLSAVEEQSGDDPRGAFGESLLHSTGAALLPDDAPWAAPPLRAVSMRQRRTDVPLLCFLRGLRALLVGMGLAADADPAAGDADCAGLLRVCFASDGGGSLVSARVTSAVAARFERFVVGCLRRRVHPLDELRRCRPGAVRPAGLAGLAVPLLADAAAVVAAWPSGPAGGLAALVAGSEPARRVYWIVGRGAAAKRAAAAAVRAWRDGGRPVGKELDTFTGDALDEGDVLHVEGEERQERRVLRRERFPMEELLLAELRNACKLARGADERAENWVRREAFSETARGGGEKEKGDTAGAGHTRAAVSGEEERGTLVSDGQVYLWRVPLGEGEERIIAVTARFGGPPQKKKTGRQPNSPPREASERREGMREKAHRLSDPGAPAAVLQSTETQAAKKRGKTKEQCAHFPEHNSPHSKLPQQQQQRQRQKKQNQQPQFIGTSCHQSQQQSTPVPPVHPGMAPETSAAVLPCGNAQSSMTSALQMSSPGNRMCNKNYFTPSQFNTQRQKEQARGCHVRTVSEGVYYGNGNNYSFSPNQRGEYYQNNVYGNIHPRSSSLDSFYFYNSNSGIPTQRGQQQYLCQRQEKESHQHSPYYILPPTQHEHGAGGANSMNNNNNNSSNNSSAAFGCPHTQPNSYSSWSPTYPSDAAQHSHCESESSVPHASPSSFPMRSYDPHAHPQAVRTPIQPDAPGATINVTVRHGMQHHRTPSSLNVG